MLMLFGKGAKVGAKQNTARVADKLMDDVRARGVNLQIAWGSLTDLLRLSVNCRSIAEFFEVLKKFSENSF